MPPGQGLFERKDYKPLPGVFERIMKIDPNSASAHVMMGTACDQMSDWPNAITEYQAAVAADSRFMGAHSGLGHLYWRQGDVENAEKEMRAELEHFPNDPVANSISRPDSIPQLSARRRTVAFRTGAKGKSPLPGRARSRQDAKRFEPSRCWGRTFAQSDAVRSQFGGGPFRPRHRPAKVRPRIGNPAIPAASDSSRGPDSKRAGLSLKPLL